MRGHSSREDGGGDQRQPKYLSITDLACEHIDPASGPMALQFSLEDGELPQTVGELRVFGSNAGCANRCVKAAEHLLEGVAVAFSVAAGQVGVAARLGLEQGRILEEELVAGVAVANPEFVGPLLVPCGGGFCAVNLDAEPVLASGGDLAGDDAAARARAHAEDHRAEVFRIDGRLNIVFRAEQLVGKGFDRVFGLLARGVEGLQIGAKRSDTQAGDVLGHVEPVRANVGHGSAKGRQPWSRCASSSQCRRAASPANTCLG